MDCTRNYGHTQNKYLSFNKRDTLTRKEIAIPYEALIKSKSSGTANVSHVEPGGNNGFAYMRTILTVTHVTLLTHSLGITTHCIVNQ